MPSSEEAARDLVLHDKGANGLPPALVVGASLDGVLLHLLQAPEIEIIDRAVTITIETYSDNVLEGPEPYTVRLRGADGTSTRPLLCPALAEGQTSPVVRAKDYSDVMVDSQMEPVATYATRETATVSFWVGSLRTVSD